MLMLVYGFYLYFIKNKIFVICIKFDCQKSIVKCPVQNLFVNIFKTGDNPNFHLKKSFSVDLSDGETSSLSLTDTPSCSQQHFSSDTSFDSSDISLSSSESSEENIRHLNYNQNDNILVLYAHNINNHRYGYLHSPFNHIQFDSSNRYLTGNIKLSNKVVRINDNEIPTTSKMQDGDSHQRQPLLPKKKLKKKENFITRVFLIIRRKHSVEEQHTQQSDNEVTVSITSSTASEDVSIFPNEICKTLLALMLMVINFILTLASLSLIHEFVPDRDTYTALPDIFLAHVSAQDWALDISEYLIMISVLTTILVLLFHKYKSIVLRRIFLIMSLLYFMRAITMFVTVLPVASKTYYCSPKAKETTFYLIVTRVYHMLTGFGLSVAGQHTYCGDYIYSGHTVILMICYLVIAEYTPQRLFALHWVYGSVAFVGVIMVLLSHGHYTVDVIIAYYVTTRVFWIYHTLANNAELKKKGRYNYLAKSLWFCLFQYFEKNVGGPLPCQYCWPLPWPKKWQR